jgi:hypothetical protein
MSPQTVTIVMTDGQTDRQTDRVSMVTTANILILILVHNLIFEHIAILMHVTEHIFIHINIAMHCFALP